MKISTIHISFLALTLAGSVSLVSLEEVFADKIDRTQKAPDNDQKDEKRVVSDALKGKAGAKENAPPLSEKSTAVKTKTASMMNANNAHNGNVTVESHRFGKVEINDKQKIISATGLNGKRLFDNLFRRGWSQKNLPTVTITCDLRDLEKDDPSNNIFHSIMRNMIVSGDGVRVKIFKFYQGKVVLTIPPTAFNLPADLNEVASEFNYRLPSELLRLLSSSPDATVALTYSDRETYNAAKNMASA